MIPAARRLLPGAAAPLVALVVLDLAFLAWCAVERIPVPPGSKPPAWTFTLTVREGKLYRQVESSGTEKGLPAGLLRAAPGEPPPFPMPELRLEPAGDAAVLRAADAAALKDLPDGAVILHDDPAAAFPGGPRPLGQEKEELAVLLDASGTMAQDRTGSPGKNVFQYALGRLLERRRGEERPWHLYTFSDRLRDHGAWTRQDPALLASLPPPKGRTALLEALAGQLDKARGPRKIVVVSDGAISETDRESVLEALRTLRASGASLALLSPELGPVERFDFIYRQGLAAPAWPDLAPPRAVGSSTVGLPAGGGIPWSGVFPTRASEGLLPLLFCREGFPALYVGTRGGRSVFHAVGRPGADPAKLPGLLGRGRARAPVVAVEPRRIVVDLLGDQDSGLRVDRGAGWEPVAPSRPGVFVLPLSGPPPGRLGFHHPASGPFFLEGLDSLAGLWPAEGGGAGGSWHLCLAGRAAGPAQVAAACILALLHMVAFTIILLRRSA